MNIEFSFLCVGGNHAKRQLNANNIIYILPELFLSFSIMSSFNDWCFCKKSFKLN